MTASLRCTLALPVDAALGGFFVLAVNWLLLLILVRVHAGACDSAGRCCAETAWAHAAVLHRSLWLSAAPPNKAAAGVRPLPPESRARGHRRPL